MPDGSRVPDAWVKWMRVLAYGCMGSAGVLCIVSPILTFVYPSTAEAMAWFLVVGGYLSMVGAYIEHWWGEYIGIPLLASAFSVFAIITWQGNWDYAPYLATANLLLLASVALGLMARWRDARAVFRLANHLSRRERGRE